MSAAASIRVERSRTPEDTNQLEIIVIDRTVDLPVGAFDLPLVHLRTTEASCFTEELKPVLRTLCWQAFGLQDSPAF